MVRIVSLSLTLVAGIVLAAVTFGAYREPAEQEKHSTGQLGPQAPSEQEAIVTKGPFSVSLSFRGMFEAAEIFPISVNPEAWKPDAGGAPLVLRRVVPHGTRVSKGQPLLTFDLDRLTETIRDLEANLRLSELAIQILERELPILKESIPLDLAAADRARKEAQEDLDRFVKEDRAFAEKLADENVKMGRFFVEFAEEEMRQLEKMYKADDLVEDTERIILRRQQMYIDLYKLLLAQDEKQRRDLLQYELPRKDVSLRERLLKLSLEDSKLRATLSLSAERKQLELEKARFDRERNDQRLAKLRRDLKLLEGIVAPTDGYVYYGRIEDGQWLGYEEAKGQLVPGNVVVLNKVLMTVASPKVSHVAATIEERDLHLIQRGAKVRLSPVSRPDAKLSGEVESITALPSAPEKFKVRITVSEAGDAPLVPLTTANVKLVSYYRELALTLPSEAVQTDELDDTRRFVEVRSPDGKKVRRYVKVGKDNGKRMEILEGLSEGEKVLLSAPGDKAEQPAK
jgi:HlyD family secretion protein